MYLVKKDIVQEVTTVWDYLIKRFDLDPLIAFLNALLENLMKSINSYAALEKFTEVLTELIDRLKLYSKFGIA